jgi:hypothetical protein
VLALSWWPLAFIAQFTPWQNQLLGAAVGAWLIGGIGFAVFHDDDGASTKEDLEVDVGSRWGWVFYGDGDGDADWD